MRTAPAPTGRSSLAAIPDVLLDELARARRGVVALAVDGLSHPAAVAAGWDTADLSALDSTFPSISATAWLTALTGVGPDRHGVPGMVYRVPGLGTLVDAITGTVLARGRPDPGADPRLVISHPTVFDRAAAAGIECRAMAREIGELAGPWARAVLHGATRLAATSGDLAVQAADPARLVTTVTADVDGVLAVAPTGRRLLLWVYVNLDDHVHGHGYDAAALAAARGLGEAAARWSSLGWTVVAHSDHGQVPHRPDAALVRAWSEVDSPADCTLPAGGAGRVRWLYPRSGRVHAVRARLVDALGDAAAMLTDEDLARSGLPAADGVLRGRIGAVVAVARSAAFPGYDPTLRWEHGAAEPDEMRVPLAVWR